MEGNLQHIYISHPKSGKAVDNAVKSAMNFYSVQKHELFHSLDDIKHAVRDEQFEKFIHDSLTKTEEKLIKVARRSLKNHLTRR